jgi:hypothetical protein
MMATKRTTQKDVQTRVPEPKSPPLREEYPGPQTASTGEHIEPGDVKPTLPRRRGGQQR